MKKKRTPPNLEGRKCIKKGEEEKDVTIYGGRKDIEKEIEDKENIKYGWDGKVWRRLRERAALNMN